MMHGHYSNEIYDTGHLCVGGFRNSIRTEPKNSRQYKINNGAAAGGEYILRVFLIYSLLLYVATHTNVFLVAVG